MRTDPLADTAWTSAEALLFPAATRAGDRSTLSARDVAAHIERALAMLGWNPLDQAEVRRPTGGAGEPLRLELRTGEEVRVVILVFEPSDPLSAHAALPWRGKEEAKWLMLTDGSQWMVFRPEEKQRPPFETVSAGDPTARGRLTGDVARDHHLRQHLLDRILSGRDADALFAEYQAIFRRTAPVAHALSERLKSRGIQIPLDELAAALEAVAATQAGHAASPGGDLDGADSGGKTRASAGYAPPSVDEARWPAGATHRLARKGLASFIRFDPITRQATLLPGSVMRVKTGRSFPGHHRRLRETALAAGLLRVEGDLLRVVAELTLETPTTAATLVSGVSDDGWRAWRDPEGNTISRSAPIEDHHDVSTTPEENVLSAEPAARRPGP